MKLLELDIRNVRGIKALNMSLSGQNCVIWGPNGSGKSAVVDAIDFLLTGRISRLTGEGTRDISLKKHGPHVDTEPKDAVVTARVEIPGHAEQVQLRRKMSSPAVLEYPPSAKGALEPILDLAIRGQHVLSRRDILRFVAAEAGKRAQEVQAVLNLSRLEEIRRTFYRVLNNAKADEGSSTATLGSTKARVKNSLNLELFEESAVLQAINALRAVLSGEPIRLLKSSELKSGLAAPSSTPEAGPQLNPKLLRTDLGKLTGILDDAKKSVEEPDRELRERLKEVRDDEEALKNLSRLELYELGVSLIDETGACPLCGTSWSPGALKKRIEERIATARAVERKRNRIRALAVGMSTSAQTLRTYVDHIQEAAARLGLREEKPKLLGWSEELQGLVNDLRDPLANYPRAERPESRVGCFLAPTGGRKVAEKVVEAAESASPSPSPQQTAWDTLTRLEENWRQHEEAVDAHVSATRFLGRAETLYQCFENARDEILDSLYRSVESRFSDLYRSIHSDDEKGFESSLRPEGASLIFEVDFYGRGKHPPLALHSEGHQDTMGLCLYLALAEKLTAGQIELTILDDVVMSVDAGHRRNVCNLLHHQFPDRQFIITTHDRTWMRELEIEGVVSRKNLVEFTRWTVDAGPLVTMEANLWSKVEEDVRSDDIPSAAGRLRRGLEQYFELVCDRLHATVRFRSDGRWELSDFVCAAIGEYRSLLRKTKASAQSWADSDLVERFNELETTAKQIIILSQAEQWAVNANVHYNRWVQFSPADFRPVSDAMRNLYDLFKCTTCGGVLFVTTQNLDPVTLRCSCGKVNWNLLKKR